MKAYRIWFACSFGLALSMLFGWNFGFLAIVLPMFVLSNTDHFHLPLLLMIFGTAIWTTLQMSLVWDIFKGYPFAMTVLVGIIFLCKCMAMTNKKTFLMGYMGLLVGSIMLNFSSYSFMDIEEFSITIWVYCIVNFIICALAYWLFPASDQTKTETNKETKVQQSSQQEPPMQGEQLTILWLLPMIAFIIFQVADLHDSAAAHASILIILAPMTCVGALQMVKVRIIGTALGCGLGLAMQLTLGLWFENAFLYWLLLTIVMAPLCYWQTQGVVKSAISFSAMAALTVPMTTVLTPGETDAFFALLYRFSSILFAVVLSALVILLIQKVLQYRNRERLCN
ncbi:DUF2955 domain-containing protein [Vibrio rarus]|uniref:DUF2955 domain-containing protein n=1 Tax=Vibrio rarus TaxID=413403 RepID=UPI0021C33740|nr:DUF2955 domain-containing protein [Vibrio rarus]